MTPEERYKEDPAFKLLVDTLQASMHRAEFSPSEVRLAALLASINFEMLRVNRVYIIPEAEKALKTLDEIWQGNNHEQ